MWCHIAKVVIAFSQDSRQIPIASDAPPRHTSRGFLHWRLSDDGPGASRIVPVGRHPKPFTKAALTAPKSDFRCTPESGLKLDSAQCPGSVESRCDAVALGSNISVAAPFVRRFLTCSTMAPFSHPAHR